MAKAVEFREFTPRDLREDLVRRVKEAPVEHAEAILSAYDLLQRLEDKGILDLFNGLLSASDQVVERVTDVVSSKQAVNALRLSLILGNLLTSIDPDKLQEALNVGRSEHPPSVLAIARSASSKDARRGIGAVTALLNVFGAALGSGRDTE